MERKSIKLPIVYRTGSSENISNIEEMERTVCFVCATEHPKLWAIYECSHKVCTLCALRLRDLYGSRACVMCKVESSKVMVINSDKWDKQPQHSFERILPHNYQKLPNDPSTGIYFPNEEIKSLVLSVRLFTCPVERCSKKGGAGGSALIFNSKDDLKKHVNQAHSLSLCSICLSHKKVFPSEYQVYSQADLGRHQRGNSIKGEGGHPSCTLCNVLFYSDDELTLHRREKHEECFICKRYPQKDAYFMNYDKLEEHFGREHFLCPERLCREMKFIVYETELELRVHRAEMHLSSSAGNDGRMQRSAQQQLRRLDPHILSYQPVQTPQSSSRSRRNVDRPITSNETSSTPASLPQQPTPTPTPIVIPAEVKKNLIFGDAISELAGRMQSLSMYEQSNLDYLTSLHQTFHLSKGKISSIRALCTNFQQGILSALDLIVRVEGMVGVDHLERIGMGLCELELEVVKRRQLEAAIKHRIKLASAFPSLPTSPAITSSAASSVSSFNRPKASVMRIKPVSVVNRQSSTMTTDPSRNPLALLGAKSTASLTSKSTKISSPRKNDRPPSFRQAIATSSSVAIVSEGGSDGPSIDHSAFPTLPQSTASTAAPKPVECPNPSIFASSVTRNMPQTFTIGTSSEDQVQGATVSSGKKKNKKGQVLFKYG